MIAHLKKKWGITNNFDFTVIMLVFSLAGMAIGTERKPVFALLGFTNHTAWWIKTIVYLPLFVPLYQMNLLLFGTVLGQFNFFWEKEKRLGRFFLKAFKRLKTQN